MTSVADPHSGASADPCADLRERVRVHYKRYAYSFMSIDEGKLMQADSKALHKALDKWTPGTIEDALCPPKKPTEKDKCQDD